MDKRFEFCIALEEGADTIETWIASVTIGPDHDGNHVASSGIPTAEEIDEIAEESGCGDTVAVYADLCRIAEVNASSYDEDWALGAMIDETL